MISKTLPVAVDERIESKTRAMWTMVPAVVKAVDNVNAKVDIQPKVWLKDVEDNDVQAPVIRNVPVIFQRGGGCVIKVPVAVDDIVMALFSKFPLTGVLDNRDLVKPTELRRFSFNDAVVLPGFFITGDNDISIPTNIEISHKDGAYIKLGKDGIGTFIEFNAERYDFK